MIINSKKYKKQLSQSILLEERGTPEALRITILFIVILLLLFLFWASRVELKETVSTQGTLVPGQKVIEIENPRSGIVEEVHIQNNKTIKKGDKIISLNNESLELSLEEEKIRLKVLNAEGENIRKELATARELEKERLMSYQEYREVLKKSIENQGARSISEKKIKRLSISLQENELTSPITGKIHNLSNLHKGSVLQTGATICSILPEGGDLSAEVIIDPRDRGKIDPGHTVELHFDSYDYEFFGGMRAHLKEISGTTFTAKNGRTFYKGVIELPENYLEKGNVNYPLQLGMPVTAEIQIGEKTLLQYIINPIKTSAKKAFHEE